MFGSLAWRDTKHQSESICCLNLVACGIFNLQGSGCYFSRKRTTKMSIWNTCWINGELKQWQKWTINWIFRHIFVAISLPQLNILTRDGLMLCKDLISFHSRLQTDRSKLTPHRKSAFDTLFGDALRRLKKQRPIFIAAWTSFISIYWRNVEHLMVMQKRREEKFTLKKWSNSTTQ